MTWSETLKTGFLVSRPICGYGLFVLLQLFPWIHSLVAYLCGKISLRKQFINLPRHLSENGVEFSALFTKAQLIIGERNTTFIFFANYKYCIGLS